MKDLNGEFVQDSHVLYDDKEHRRERRCYRKVKQKKFRRKMKEFINNELSYFDSEAKNG